MMNNGNSDAPCSLTVTQLLNVTDNKTGDQRSLAYRKLPGTRAPGIIFISGFMATKDDVKPVALEEFASKHRFPFIRYDATGLGESQGPIELKDARLSHWLQDAEEILMNLTDGPQLVIGSSMGGWIASILAKKYPEKFASLLLLAPSINFSAHYINRLKSRARPSRLEILEKGGSFDFNDPKFGTYPLSLVVFEEMIPYEIPLEEESSYPVKCPVRLIHGTKDPYSPYEISLKLLKAFATSDVQLLYLKDVDHYLDTDKTLEIIWDVILKMANGSKL
ncbi:hypothetical protein SK128_008427 [Halocaridina rubra]|uniref:Palmitoyl-protein thioesterase ABHD10, mitochondrial n=1 Tax=Halocaridina rubra TaxID=373956 RepID=A0AAN9A0U2_HALRR